MVNNKKQQITEKYKKELEEQLEYRKVTLRTEIGNAIKEAREQGDLSENADYSSAREKQSENEAKIAEIEEILKYAEIVKTTHIVIKYVALNKIDEYDISGSESNPFEKKISSESPLAKAVAGHKKGDIVTMTTEAGKDIKIEIISID